MAFDLLTLDEVEFIEEGAGRSLGDIFAGNAQPTAKVIKLVAFVVKRRAHPDLTIEEMGSMSYEEAVGYIAAITGVDEPDPKARVTHAGRVTKRSGAGS